MVLEFFTSLISNYGLLGLFAVNAISSASILFPLPGAALVFGASALLNPFLVGIFSALGATIGELSGYLLGVGGRKAADSRFAPQLKKIEKMFQRYRGFVVIIVFAALPLPFDIIGIFCGTVKYPLHNFYISTLIGKLIKFMVIAYAGFYGITFVKEFFAFL